MAALLALFTHSLHCPGIRSQRHPWRGDGGISQLDRVPSRARAHVADGVRDDDDLRGRLPRHPALLRASAPQQEVSRGALVALADLLGDVIF